MKLSRKSWLVRWAYSPFLLGPPTIGGYDWAKHEWRDGGTVSGCAFFWRVVLWAPLFWLALATIAVGVPWGLARIWVREGAWAVIGPLGGAVLVLAAMVLVIWQTDEAAPHGGHLRRIARAMSEQWCPRVELTED